MDALLLEGKGLTFGRFEFEIDRPRSRSPAIVSAGHQHWLGSLIQHSSSLQIKLEHSKLSAAETRYVTSSYSLPNIITTYFYSTD